LIVPAARICEGFAPQDKAARQLHQHAGQGRVQKKEPMATVFNILAVLVMVAVVVVLVRGLINMMRGGSGNTSNKLMQARVALQFVALVLIMGALWAAGG
jgi:hypothetical protein